jgi:pimeloyl-ACP methyl ester carboxylesterase
MRQFKLFSFPWLISLAYAQGCPAVPHCSTVSFHVTVTADNAVFLSPPHQNNETAILDFFYVGLANGTGPAVKGTTPVTGTFTIEGHYCRPSGGAEDKNVLELLVHGISYNKLIWSGLNLGDDLYDWQLYASNHGYSTLAIDRLGHGTNPQRPDPLNIVQGYLEIQIEHQILNSIRASPENPLGRTFGKIVYGSHSYGGWLGIGLAHLYPSDIDALVLTGFSAGVTFVPFETLQLISASLMKPERFPLTPLGYLTVKEKSQREHLFYGGAYRKAVVEWDYATEDTWTIGETSALSFVVPPTDYTGLVYVATGMDDLLFCQTSKATCETVLNETRGLFPAVTNFGYAAIPNTGHVLMMHESAQQTFAYVHNFLSQALP